MGGGTNKFKRRIRNLIIFIFVRFLRVGQTFGLGYGLVVEDKTSVDTQFRDLFTAYPVIIFNV